jgi:hypothetical protein
MRQASAIIARHHKAVVLAWLDGANVGDGDPITDKGLRWSLLKLLDEFHRKTATGVVRPYRRGEDDSVTAPLVANPTTRRMVLEAVADMMSGQSVPEPLADFVGKRLAPFFTGSMASRTSSGVELRAAVESIHAMPTQNALSAMLQQRDPETAATIDLSTAAAQKFVKEAPRTRLDQVRDWAAQMLDPQLDPNSAYGALVGLLAGAAAGGATTTGTRDS